MEARRMELTLSSAHDLKKASMISKTRAYAVAWISNDPKNRQRTPVDKSNGTDPIWNHDMKFTLDEAALQQGRLFLEIAVCSGATFGDKEIGRISIPFNEFLNPATTSEQFATYQLKKPSGKPKGLINLSVKLAEKPEVIQLQQPQAVAGTYGAAMAEPANAYPAASFGSVKAEPVTAYPAYPPAGSSSHPPPNNHYPPPQAAGYPAPPPYYQGYAPPPYQGYPPNQGYPPYQGYAPVAPAAQKPPGKNNKLGMGLGAGLIGGALGGLLLGDVISDATYDGGDGGFDDDGGDFGSDF